MTRLAEPSGGVSASEGAPDAAPDDAALVERVLRGEREGFRPLVERYQARLFHYARGMRIAPDPARDLVQDAFVRAYTRLDDCRDPARFRVWLFRILRNLCLDHLKDVRRQRVPIEDVLIVDERDGPAEDVERHELGDRLRAALDTLGEAHRDAFLMKHLEERSYDEMAEIADTSVSAMKMRVHRAREALRDALLDAHDELPV